MPRYLPQGWVPGGGGGVSPFSSVGFHHCYGISGFFLEQWERRLLGLLTISREALGALQGAKPRPRTLSRDIDPPAGPEAPLPVPLPLPGLCWSFGFLFLAALGLNCKTWGGG